MLPGLTPFLGEALRPISRADVTPSIQAWPSSAPYDRNFGVTHNGIGPFTYAWTATPSAGTTISSPNAQSTTVSRANNSTIVTMNCTVTDLAPGGSSVVATPGIIEQAP